ncbi:hypothetical protein Tco_0528296 [Tanacetum coccineum]
MTLMCILIVPQQNTGFILDSDMEGKNEESYKFPIAVQQSFNSLWSQDVRGDPDSGIGGLQIQAPSSDFSFDGILLGNYILDSWYSLGGYKTSHDAVKRIFQYIKGTTHLGLWYPKGTNIETVVYAESDHARDYVNQKSTSGICTLMGCCFTSWFSKKQTTLAISTTKAEYVRARNACQQTLWMKQALIDYDVRLDDVPIMCDNKGVIDLSKTRCNTLELSTSKFVTTFFVIMSKKDI